MAEAFACDRCGAVFPGSPHGTITAGDGIARSRPEDGQYKAPEGVSTHQIHDVCKDCLDSFDGWVGCGGCRENSKSVGGNGTVDGGG